MSKRKPAVSKRKVIDPREHTLVSSSWPTQWQVIFTTDYDSDVIMSEHATIEDARKDLFNWQGRGLNARLRVVATAPIADPAALPSVRP